MEQKLYGKNKQEDFDEKTFSNNVGFFVDKFIEIYNKYCEKANFDLEFTFATYIFYYMLKKIAEDNFRRSGATIEEIKEFEEEAKKIGEENYKIIMKKKE